MTFFFLIKSKKWWTSILHGIRFWVFGYKIFSQHSFSIVNEFMFPFSLKLESGDAWIQSTIKSAYFDAISILNCCSKTKLARILQTFNLSKFDQVIQVTLMISPLFNGFCSILIDYHCYADDIHEFFGKRKN